MIQFLIHTNLRKAELDGQQIQKKKKNKFQDKNQKKAEKEIM
jgi:hypothetical protein